ncbi:hypothetical protein ES703_108163 [subsurface metagenome]
MNQIFLRKTLNFLFYLGDGESCHFLPLNDKLYIRNKSLNQSSGGLDKSSPYTRYIKHVHKIHQTPAQMNHPHNKKEGSDLHNFYNFSFFSHMLKSLSFSFS